MSGPTATEERDQPRRDGPAQPPRMPAAIWLLLRMAARAWLNRLSAGSAARKAAQAEGATPRRGPTPRKRRIGRWVVGLLVVPLLAQSFLLCGVAVSRLMTVADSGPVLGERSWIQLDEGRGVGPRGQTVIVVGSEHQGELHLADERRIAAHEEARSDDEATRSAALAELAALRAWAAAVARHDPFLRDMPAEFAARRAEVVADAWLAGGADAVRAIDDALMPSPASMPSGGDAAAYAGSVVALLAACVAMLLVLALGMGNQDLGRVEWSMLWLATLPVPTSTLFAGRLVEYAWLSPVLWATVWPFTAAAFLGGGAGWTGAIAGGAVAAAGTGLLVGGARLGIETWLRLHVAPTRLKSLQAAATVVGMLSLVLIYGVALTPAMTATFGEAVGRTMPLPLVAEALATPGGRGALVAFALAAGSAGAAAALAWSARLVRRGFITQDGAYAGRRGSAGERGFPPLPPLRKDVLLLLRDRNLLVQVLVVPLFVIGLQLMVNRELLGGITSEFRHAAAFAFTLGAYTLMSGAVGALAAEGPGLWLLCAAPVPLERLLARKAMLWALIGGGFSLATLIAGAAVVPELTPLAISDAALVLIGVPLYAVIAVALGAAGTDPLEIMPQRRVSPNVAGLFLLVAGMYAYVIYAPSLHAKLAQLVLSLLLAFALWQKLRDRLPFLLDPTAAPPRRLDLADGLIAALAFFVCQGLLTLAFLQAGLEPAAALMAAFAGAGVLIAAVALLALWRLGVPDLLREVGLLPQRGARWAWGRSALAGGAGAALAGAFAWAYLAALAWLGIDPADAAGPLSGIEDAVALALIAVVVAPLCEEFVFRSLVFGGLRRSLPWGWAAVASAAIFALVHPSLAVIPVFGLGLAAAAAYRFGGTLWAAVLVHAGYNSLVLRLASS